MVKRTSFLASNEAFRVRILVGVLLKTLEPDGQATGCNPVEVGSIPTGVSSCSKRLDPQIQLGLSACLSRLPTSFKPLDVAGSTLAVSRIKGKEKRCAHWFWHPGNCLTARIAFTFCKRLPSEKLLTFPFYDELGETF